MPKFRRLSGQAVIRILEQFGFAFERQKGSHVHLYRNVNNQKQKIIVPVHGKQEVKTGTLNGIYNIACKYIPEEEIRPHFYTD
jgi:predicted RNA binding protein YcfA (HicA-like mRNA interferase family)